MRMHERLGLACLLASRVPSRDAYKQVDLIYSWPPYRCKLRILHGLLLFALYGSGNYQSIGEGMAGKEIDAIPIGGNTSAW